MEEEYDEKEQEEQEEQEEQDSICGIFINKFKHKANKNNNL